MNIRSIKDRANQMIVGCKPQLIRIIAIVMLIGLIPDFITSNNGFARILSILVSLLFLTWEHGIIVSTLKVVRNNGHALSDDDAFIGFKRIRDLFSTYFVSSFITIITCYVVAFVLIIIFATIMSSYIDISLLTNSMGLSSEYILWYLIRSIYQAPSLLLAFLIIVFIMIVVSLIITAYVFPMPYLKEQYQMSAGQSLKESFSLMSGHVWEFIKLELSFLGWIVIAVVLQLAIEYILSFLPILGAMIGAIAAAIFSLYTYIPQYKVSQAIFFEELAYYRYDYQQQGEHFYAE